jgi:hypothetical protein
VASTESSLVMGFTARLPHELLHTFFASLRRSGYLGQTCLVAALYARDEIERLRELVDHLVEVPPIAADDRMVSERTIRLLRWVRSTRGVRRAYSALFRSRCAVSREHDAFRLWAQLELELEGLQSLRYGYYHEFLTAHPGAFDQVFLSDLRDVAFQSDPFEPAPDALELFLEDEAHSFASETFNQRWLTHLEGRRFAEWAGPRVPSCSGTVVGPTEDVLAYLGAMRAEISWRRIPMGNHDQGVHNALLLKGRLEAAEVFANGAGRVLTMGGMPEPALGPTGLVTTADGRVPAVLHQYDRFPLLAAQIARYE